MNKKIPIIISCVLLAAVGGYVFYQRMGNTNSDISGNADTSSNTKHGRQKPSELIAQFKHDVLPLSGSYQWQFYLGPVEQISTHTFTADYIDYRMTGKVYSTDYRIYKLSYDKDNKKWIGETKDGTVYVLFFKDMKKNTMTLYKHKCKHGLAEAISFKRPADNATTDHGWNVYTREGLAAETDDLPLLGVYQNKAKQTISLSDASVTWQGKTYQKLTHHFGEKRWVGQHGDDYILVFYEMPRENMPLKLSIHIVTDIEKAYKVKHGEQVFTDYKIKGEMP